MLEDLSIGKILFILLVVLIFFGPKKIPDIAQSIGKGIKEFKKAMHDVSDEIKKTTDDEANRNESRRQTGPPTDGGHGSSSTIDQNP